jgi:hypothetical protein
MLISQLSLATNIVCNTRTYSMRKITLLLLGLIVFINVNAQINIQLPETFLTYQIPKSLKMVNNYKFYLPIVIP